MKNFDRQYRVRIERGDGGSFEFGDSPMPLHIEFSFQKTELETANTGKLSIWNLNKEHIAMLQKKWNVLTFRAGYGDVMPIIFKGIISHAIASKDGSDIKTEIELLDSLTPIKEGYVSISYREKVSWKKIIDDTAKQLGIPVLYGQNATFKDIASFSYVGSAEDLLNDAGDSNNLSWCVNNGILQVWKKGSTINQVAYLLSPKTGMVGIPTQEVISLDDETGENLLVWNVEILLNGAIAPADYVKVESMYLSGYYRVYSVEMNGDNYGGDWKTKVKLAEVTANVF